MAALAIYVLAASYVSPPAWRGVVASARPARAAITMQMRTPFTFDSTSSTNPMVGQVVPTSPNYWNYNGRSMPQYNDRYSPQYSQYNSGRYGRYYPEDRLMSRMGRVGGLGRYSPYDDNRYMYNDRNMPQYSQYNNRYGQYSAEDRLTSRMLRTGGSGRYSQYNNGRYMNQYSPYNDGRYMQYNNGYMNQYSQYNNGRYMQNPGSPQYWNYNGRSMPQYNDRYMMPQYSQYNNGRYLAGDRLTSRMGRVGGLGRYSPYDDDRYMYNTHYHNSRYPQTSAEDRLSARLRRSGGLDQYSSYNNGRYSQYYNSRYPMYQSRDRLSMRLGRTGGMDYSSPYYTGRNTQYPALPPSNGQSSY